VPRRENLHFFPPVLCSIGMLQRELHLRCCISVVLINIYTRRTDRRNADLKIESTPRHHRKTKSNRGRLILSNEWCTFISRRCSVILCIFWQLHKSFFSHHSPLFRISYYCLLGCDFIWGYQCFRGAYYFQLQGLISTLRAETALFSETLIFISKTTRRHKPEHNNLNEHCH